jgi:hypothetical protein
MPEYLAPGLPDRPMDRGPQRENGNAPLPHSSSTARCLMRDSERDSTMRQMVFSRPHYFDGQLLTAKDFEAEQIYHLDKQRFRNRHVHGTGIVSGLRVRVGPDRSSIMVTPGYAIDAQGRDICVPCEVSITLPPQAKGISVWISYVEAAAMLTSGLQPSFEHDNLASRIEEGFEIEFILIPSPTRGQQPAPLPPPSKPDAWLLLGVLHHKGNTWRLDPKHPQPQPKSPQQRRHRDSGKLK